MHVADEIMFVYRRTRWTVAAVAIALCFTTDAPTPAAADSSGLSVWLPGLMGSLAAVPCQPGWSWLSVYVHINEIGERDCQLRQEHLCGRRAPRAIGRARGGSRLHLRNPRCWAGKPQSACSARWGNVDAGIDATLTGPRGNTISGSSHDNRTTLSDVFWQGTLKWNSGVNNWIVYATGNIPSGTYDLARLANLSLGWAAVDAGGAYTYLDRKRDTSSRRPQGSHTIS